MPDPSSSATTPALSQRVIFLMTLSCALAVSTIYYHQPLLPQMASSFGVPLARTSLIATLTQFGYAAGLLFFVPLGDRVQPRKLASFVISANAVALLACALAPSFAALAACSFLVGMTAVTAQIIIPAVSGQASAQTRGRIVGSLLGGLSAGLLLARTLSGFIGAQLGWRAIFVLASAVDLALLAVVIRNLPVSSGLSTIRYRDLMRSLGEMLREERVLRISAATGFLMFAAFSALWATLAALLARPPYEFGPAAIGSLVDRFSSRNVVFAGAILLAVGFAFVARSGHSLVWLVIGMVLLDFGNRAGLVANQSRVFALRPEARSRLNTVFIASYFLGGAAGAALGGYAAHQQAWAGLAALGAVLAFAAMAVNSLAMRLRPAGA